MSSVFRDHQTGTSGDESPLTSLPGRPAHVHFKDVYDTGIEMVWPGDAPLEVPSLPPGYVLRQFKVDEEAAYKELFHLGFSSDDKFEHTLATEIDDGVFVVEHTESDHLVATCVAQHIEAEEAQRQIQRFRTCQTQSWNC